MAEAGVIIKLDHITEKEPKMKSVLASRTVAFLMLSGYCRLNKDKYLILSRLHVLVSLWMGRGQY